MQSRAKTVEEYLSELPDDRRNALSAVRRVILDNLDGEYEEGMQYGMIGYYVPHSVFPAGYHCDPRQPLPFAGLGSQKNYMSLHVMCLYMSGEQQKWFADAWKKSGKKLDMGKACIRFKKLEDLALDVIGEAIRRVPARKYIAVFEAVRLATAKAKSTGSANARRKVTAKPVTRKAGAKSPKLK